MNKTLKIYGVVLVLVMLALLLLQLNKKTVIDWRKTFALKEKSPFGLFVFNKEADKLFGQKLERIYKSPYQYFSEDSIQAPQNLLLIERELTNPAWKKILNRVEKGDDVFILQQHIPNILKDSLIIGTRRVYLNNTTLHSTDKKIKKDTLFIDKMPSSVSISKIDTLHTTTLGYKKNMDKKNIFIKVNYGKGNFYIHTEPLIITNYYILKKENEKYITSIFSYLKNRKTLWFLQDESAKAQSKSPLRFILKNPPLRYAWYLFFTALLLFIIFNAKRKQRIVPIVEPLKNTSVDFVKSIGNLYLQEGNYKEMAHKKATYFLHKVRTELLIDTQKLDDDFIKKLQLKTGKSKHQIEKAVRLLKIALNPYEVMSEGKLTELNKTVNEIYR